MSSFLILPTSSIFLSLTLSASVPPVSKSSVVKFLGVQTMTLCAKMGSSLTCSSLYRAFASLQVLVKVMCSLRQICLLSFCFMGPGCNPTIRWLSRRSSPSSALPSYSCHLENTSCYLSMKAPTPSSGLCLQLKRTSFVLCSSCLASPFRVPRAQSVCCC